METAVLERPASMQETETPFEIPVRPCPPVGRAAVGNCVSCFFFSQCDKAQSVVDEIAEEETESKTPQIPGIASEETVWLQSNEQPEHEPETNSKNNEPEAKTADLSVSKPVKPVLIKERVAETLPANIEVAEQPTSYLAQLLDDNVAEVWAESERTGPIDAKATKPEATRPIINKAEAIKPEPIRSEPLIQQTATKSADRVTETRESRPSEKTSRPETKTVPTSHEFKTKTDQHWEPDLEVRKASDVAQPIKVASPVEQTIHEAPMPEIQHESPVESRESSPSATKTLQVDSPATVAEPVKEQGPTMQTAEHEAQPDTPQYSAPEVEMPTPVETSTQIQELTEQTRFEPEANQTIIDSHPPTVDTPTFEFVARDTPAQEIVSDPVDADVALKEVGTESVELAPETVYEIKSKPHQSEATAEIQDTDYSEPVVEQETDEELADEIIDTDESQSAKTETDEFLESEQETAKEPEIAEESISVEDDMAKVISEDGATVEVETDEEEPVDEDATKEIAVDSPEIIAGSVITGGGTEEEMTDDLTIMPELDVDEVDIREQPESPVVELIPQIEDDEVSPDDADDQVDDTPPIVVSDTIQPENGFGLTSSVASSPLEPADIIERLARSVVAMFIKLIGA